MADFSALLADPGFQFGLSLLGNAHSTDPFAKAQASMMQYQKQQAEQQLMASQQTLIPAQVSRMAAQTDLEKQALLMQQTQFQRQVALVDAYRKSHPEVFGDAAASAPPAGAPLPDTSSSPLQPGGPPVAQSVQPPDVTQAAMPPQPPPVPTGKFGTPLSILQGLKMNESSGNPHAINPQPLANGEHAVGWYGWTPGTVDMLHKQGIDFNPVVGDNRNDDAADFYVNSLVVKNGGWNNPEAVTKALNEFQGAGKTVGSPANLKYNANALKGYQFPQNAGVTTTTQGTPPPALAASQVAANGPPTATIPQVTGQAPQSLSRNPALDMAATANVFGMAGIPGAQQLSENAKLLMPQNVPAGSYQTGPNGQSQYFPDPNAVANTKIKEKELANTTAKTALEVQKQSTELAQQKATAIAELRNTTNGMQRLSANVTELLNHPGLEANTGLSGLTGMYKLTANGRDAGILLDSLKSKLVVDTLRDLKAISKNGSSGFGQLSDPEGRILETYIENLNRAQTLPAMKKALTDLKNFAATSQDRYKEVYRNIYHEELPPLQTSAPTTTAKPTLQQFIPAARKANPGVGDKDIIAEYNKRYGE